MLKAAGFRARYKSVELAYLPMAHLRWMFRAIEIWGKLNKYVGVDVLTPEVKLLSGRSLEANKSRNGSLTFGRVRGLVWLIQIIGSCLQALETRLRSALQSSIFANKGVFRPSEALQLSCFIFQAYCTASHVLQRCSRVGS